MKTFLTLLFLSTLPSVHGQAWKTVPKGVRILGYRNVTTSKIDSTFNQFRSESSLGTHFRIDAAAINKASNGAITPGENVNAAAYNTFLIGEYNVEAEAKFNVHGTGLGYGITDNVMFYAELAYYNGEVKSNIKRTSGNTYKETEKILQNSKNSFSDAILANNMKNLPDVNEHHIQSVITNYYKYKPLGNWYGSGYGDMETGLMAKVIDKGTWGLLFYPGVVLPTGKQDDPDILQDVGFGDGQFDLFAEMATGYVLNDHLSFGTTLRYTYQAPTQKTLRIPESQDFALSEKKGSFGVKYGDKINWMVNTTLSFNDWLSITPTYRFLYQMPSEYSSEHTEANEYLAYNSSKLEHQVQLTTTISSITPFLKKKFILPAQINMNVVQTVSGKNVPKMGRFELEWRMLF